MTLVQFLAKIWNNNNNSIAMKSFLELEEIPAMKTVEQKIVICPRCKGKGTIRRCDCYGHQDDWVIHTLDCPDCRAKGRLLRTVTTLLEPLE